MLIHLSDVNGPRLTGSPGFDRAADWSRETFEKWGLTGARLENWGEFGRGWEALRCRVEMLEPYYAPLIAYPKAWTRSLDEPIEGVPVLVRLSDDGDFARYQGKLEGAIVLLAHKVTVGPRFEAAAHRYTDAELEEMTKPRQVSEADIQARRRRYRTRRDFANRVRTFLDDEGVRAVLEQSNGTDGTVFVDRGGAYSLDAPLGIPAAAVSSEQFGRLARILEAGASLRLRVELESRTFEAQPQAANVLADLPGTDPSLASEIVMLGAHLDSWHGGTGATDDAAGCAVVLEAARLLKTLGVPLRRTVRFVLWSGEEQGLLGSRAYVGKHFVDSDSGRVLPEFSKLAAYYNLDNGSGKIRGVYLQGNDAVRPIFQEFIEPVRDLGVTTLTIRNTGGTDHVPFDDVGLPGFQFIQDPLDYDTRTHHSNVDVYEHASIPDLKQAAVVMAWFAYRTAQLDAPLPRERRPLAADETPGTQEGGR